MKVLWTEEHLDQQRVVVWANATEKKTSHYLVPEYAELTEIERVLKLDDSWVAK